MQPNSILKGDSLSLLKTLPDLCADLIFADPPYFMQTKGELLRVEGAKFAGVEDSWDKFESLRDYDNFSLAWLTESRRILKDSGTIWVIGSFQNIYRLGYLMQDLGFWILNDVIWAKPNPVPNFRGSRLCNAHETLIWCAKSRGAKYTFNYKTMKHLNGEKQEKSVWNLGICIGQERLKDGTGRKIHATQKPQKLLEKIILCASREGDLVLDPFFGTGTTGAAAKKLGRQFIGIERDENYAAAAEARIRAVECESSPISRGELEVKPPKISLNALLDAGLLKAGETFFTKNGESVCILRDSGLLEDGEEILSLHKMAGKHRAAGRNAKEDSRLGAGDSQKDSRGGFAKNGESGGGKTAEIQAPQKNMQKNAPKNAPKTTGAVGDKNHPQDAAKASPNCNGWDYFFVVREGGLQNIGALRFALA